MNVKLGVVVTENIAVATLHKIQIANWNQFFFCFTNHQVFNPLGTVFFDQTAVPEENAYCLER